MNKFGVNYKIDVVLFQNNVRFRPSEQIAIRCLFENIIINKRPESIIILQHHSIHVIVHAELMHRRMIGLWGITNACFYRQIDNSITPSALYGMVCLKIIHTRNEIGWGNKGT